MRFRFSSASDATLGAFEVVSVLERFLLYIYICEQVSSREDGALYLAYLVKSVSLFNQFLMLAQAAGLIQTIGLEWH